MLNDYFSITKGQLIDLNFFATLGAMENDTPETFPVMDSNGVIRYVEANQVKRFKSGIIEVTEEMMTKPLKEYYLNLDGEDILHVSLHLLFIYYFIE